MMIDRDFLILLKIYTINRKFKHHNKLSLTRTFTFKKGSFENVLHSYIILKKYYTHFEYLKPLISLRS